MYVCVYIYIYITINKFDLFLTVRKRYAQVVYLHAASVLSIVKSWRCRRLVRLARCSVSRHSSGPLSMPSWCSLGGGGFVRANASWRLSAHEVKLAVERNQVSQALQTAEGADVSRQALHRELSELSSQCPGVCHCFHWHTQGVPSHSSRYNKTGDTLYFWRVSSA